MYTGLKSWKAVDQKSNMGCSRSASRFGPLLIFIRQPAVAFACELALARDCGVWNGLSGRERRSVEVMISSGGNQAEHRVSSDLFVGRDRAPKIIIKPGDSPHKDVSRHATATGVVRSRILHLI
jgi:hypothetical protein